MERFERLRFRALWHLPVDHAELSRLETEVLLGHARHPLVLNHSARCALPETELPAPPRGLSGVAAAFLEGDLSAAKALLKQHSGPRISVVRGDLALADGETQAAEEHFLAAQRVFGAHPPLLSRLARCQLDQDKSQGAQARLLEALSINPLHGSSRALLALTARAQDRSVLPIPLRAPVRVTAAGLETSVEMSAPHREIWRAWYRAQLQEDPAHPKAAAHAALLGRWRSVPRSDGPTDALCAQLHAWDTEGLLPAYQWSTSLNPDNAPAFRNWVDANPQALLSFWAQTLRA